MRIKIMIIIFHIFCENSGSAPWQFENINVYSTKVKGITTLAIR